MMKKLIHARYRGHSYQIPSMAKDTETVAVSRLSLTVGTQCVTVPSDEPWLFVDDSRPFTLRVTLATSDFLCGDDSADLTFYLYREGQPEPLAEASGRMFEFDDFVLDFPFEAGAFSYGSYFLLAVRVGEMNGGAAFARLGGHLCIPFTLLAEGNALHAPMPAGARLVRNLAGGEAVLFSSAAHELQLRFSGRAGGCSCFEVHCYAPGWKLMASVSRLVAAGRRSPLRMTFRLEPGRIWFEGDYTAVLSYNREPYALLTFRYGGRRVTSVGCRPLQPGEEAWWIVKRLEQTPDNKWAYIREFRGLSADMPRLVALSRMGDFNRECRRHGVGQLQAGNCLTVASADLFDARRLACLLPRFLQLDVTLRHQIDCSDPSQWEESLLDETFGERAGKAFVCYHVAALHEAAARPLLARLEQAVADRRVFSVFVLCGTAAELKALFGLSPALATCFPAESRLSLQAPSWQEAAELFCYEVEDASLRLSPAAEDALVRQMQCLGQSGRLAGWNRKEAGAVLSASVIPALQQRLQREFLHTGALGTADNVRIQPADLQPLARLSAPAPAATPVADIGQLFEESMRPINELVGMNLLKQELETLFCQVRFNRQRQCLGLPVQDGGPYHMLLTGNPGTGKTTVAKLVGKVFHALGLLSKGEVIETDRSRLVGRYIGETETNMQQVLQQARGNVLFVDEAYALCDSLDDRKDYGNHVIESLLGVLSEPCPDMVVVFAGYRDEMERLMQMNQGLRGRFPYAFHLEDYTADELMQIALHILSQRGYRLEEAACRRLQEVIAGAVEGKDRYFGNARWVGQLLVSGVLPAMAVRIVRTGGTVMADDCCLVREADVACAAARFGQPASPVLVPRRRIGFTA